MSKIKHRRKGRASAEKKVKEKNLDIYGGLREDIAIKTYLHGPMDCAKS